MTRTCIICGKGLTSRRKYCCFCRRTYEDEPKFPGQREREKIKQQVENKQIDRDIAEFELKHLGKTQMEITAEDKKETRRKEKIEKMTALWNGGIYRYGQ